MSATMPARMVPAMALLGIALAALIWAPGLHALASDGSDEAAANSSLSGPVTIGALHPLSGELSSFGEELRVATEVAVEDFNAYLAENGASWWFELVVEDTGTNPVIALDKIQAFHSRGIDMVLGPATSSNTQNIKGYADENGMLLVSCCSTSPALAIADDSIFRLVPEDNNQGAALGKVLHSHGVELLIPVWRGETYGDGLHDAVVADFEARGGQVHDGVRYNPETAEFGLEASLLDTFAREAIGEVGADKVAILAISFDEIVLIVQSASNYESLAEVRWFGAEAIAESSLLLEDPIVSKFMDDVSLVTVQFAVSPGPEIEDIRTRITEATGKSPTSFAYPAYDSVWVVGKSILKADSAAASDVKAAIRDVSAYAGEAMRSTQLDANGDLVLANYRLWAIVDQAWVQQGIYIKEKDFLTAASQPEGEVQIGSLYPLTGRLASKGVENLAGTQLGVDDFNAFLAGIDADWRLNLVAEDSETRPDAALRKVQALSSKGIEIIIGPETSSNTQQVKPYADTNDMMLISCCSSSPTLAIAGDSVFRLVPDDSKQGVALGRLLSDAGIEVAVPIWRGDVYGDGLHQATSENFASRGGMMDAGVRYNPEAVDFSGEVSLLAERVQELINEHGADKVAVFIISFDEVVQIVQAAASYDVLYDVNWFGAETLTKTTPILADASTNEFINSVPYVSLQIAENRGSVYEHVQSHIVEMTGSEPTTFVYQAYDAAWLVGLSMLKTGMTDAASVKDVFHEVANGYDGALGGTTLNEAGDLAAADYALWTISGDQWMDIGSYSLLDDMVVLADVAPEPLEAPSAVALLSDGTEVAITASEPSAGEPAMIRVVFEDSADVNYDIEVTQDGVRVYEGEGVYEADGAGEHATEPLAGDMPLDIAITFQGYGDVQLSERTGSVGETVAFARIVPEFGAVAAMILAVSVMAVALFARFGPATAWRGPA